MCIMWWNIWEYISATFNDPVIHSFSIYISSSWERVFLYIVCFHLASAAPFVDKICSPCSFLFEDTITTSSNLNTNPFFIVFHSLFHSTITFKNIQGHELIFHSASRFIIQLLKTDAEKKNKRFAGWNRKKGWSAYFNNQKMLQVSV